MAIFFGFTFNLDGFIPIEMRSWTINTFYSSNKLLEYTVGLKKVTYIMVLWICRDVLSVNFNIRQHKTKKPNLMLISKETHLAT